ncbi:MAG: AraC family transcriptional regulator [Ghiorsea sp.]|nr:AraC family transcriptional regulator [Ghiorsea sp.]
MQTHIEMIQNLVNQIEENLAENIHIPKLANNFDISPWHFQRLFKSLIGDTLGSYVRGRRLTKAAQLLHQSQLGIIDIAFEVGFNSHEAFTRSFKTYFNHSPKDFRLEKPQVLLNEKPLLTDVLLQHLTQGMLLEPTIVQRPAQTIVGFGTTIPSPFLSDEKYCDRLFNSWKSLLDRQNEISNRLDETLLGITISPSGNFTEDMLDFIAGAPTSSAEPLPEGMVIHHLPAQDIAVFNIAVVDNDTVSKTMDYIYGYWLPNAPYTRGHGDDYELFENLSLLEIPKFSKYVIPIVPK